MAEVEVVGSSVDYVAVSLAFLAGAVLGTIIGLLSGYIAGRWSRKQERAFVISDDDLPILNELIEAKKKLDKCPDMV